MRVIVVKTVEEAIKEIKETRVPLILDLGNNGIGEAGAKSLAEGIKGARVPLTLNLGTNTIGDAGAKFLTEGIKEARFPLTLELCSNGIGEVGAQLLAEGIKEARVPLTLNLWGNSIGKAGAKFLAEGIKEARFPLILNLWGNGIGDAGAKFLAEGIKEARVPLTLDSGNNGIREAGAKFLSEGIKEARTPLTLNLGGNKVGEAGAEFLAEGIKGVRVPLTLNLWKNGIGKAGAKFLAEGIKEARAPLTLKLWGNSIGEAGAQFLAEGIKEARFPLILELRINGIGDTGAKFLAEGIKEARVPLTLDLNYNQIGVVGAKFLVEGIKEARVPLTLNLEDNKVGEAGAKLLVEGIKEARVPLALNLWDIGIGDAEYKFLAEATEDNFIIDARSNPSEFFSRIKFSLSIRILEELSFPFVLVKLVQGYIGSDEDLAWLEVAAIRAIEGASHDNKYSSIDYELLAAAYSISLEAPVVVSVDAAQALNLKSIAYEKAGDLWRSLDCKERALKMYQEVYNEARPEVARSLNAIGVLHEKLGNVEEGLAYKEAALKMRMALYEGAHLDIAGSINNVGIAYELLGYIRLGLYYKEQGLTMLQSLYQDNHPAVVACLNNVALGYHKLRDAEDYIYYRVRADDIRQVIEGAQEFKGQGTLDYTDNSYPEYYNSGLDRALELRLSGLINAVSLKSRYFGNGLTDAAWQLASDISAELSKSNKVVLVPINLNNKHWLGLLFKGFGNGVEVIYMDSEQRAMLPQLKEDLEQGFGMNNYQSSFLTAKLQPQSYNNCGFELIENFVYYLTGTRATQGGAMYVHSLLVENSLLDTEVYVLKIKENNKLIGFLSNAEPIAINEITLFAEQGSENKHKRTVPDNRIAKLKTDLYRASVLFKTVDFVIDSARLAQELSLPAFKKLVINYAYLQAMVSGVNSYSVVITAAETLYQLQLGEYQNAFNVASTSMSAMALPVMLAIANRPYLVLAYGAWMLAGTAYGAVTNAYSFVLELSDNDAALRSAIAYKDLAVTLASSPLQAVYDFEAKVKEYKIQINDLLFEKDKSTVQAKVKDEFGQKVFDYIYLPELIEKYVLLNDVIRGKLTEEEAQGLKTKSIAISYGELEYDTCVRTEDYREKAAEHYYCCNMAVQILDHVVLTGSGGLEVLESL